MNTMQKFVPRNCLRLPSDFDRDLQIFSLKGVAEHCEMNDCWIVIRDFVYDVTQFVKQHPGGEDLLLEHAGCDATLAFYSSNHSKEAEHLMNSFLIGKLSHN